MVSKLTRVSSGQLPFLERPEIDNIAADSFGAGDSRKGVEVRYQKQGALIPFVIFCPRAAKR